jgi:hypothetical protein
MHKLPYSGLQIHGKYLTKFNKQRTISETKTAVIARIGRAFETNGGIFAVSRAEAKPYVEAALGDGSQLIRRRARDLWSLYQQQNK